MNRILEPLIDDQYTGEPPSKRVLAYLQAQRSQGAKNCGDLLWLCTHRGHPGPRPCACDLAPLERHNRGRGSKSSLRTFLIKSSYGFIVTDTCPFFGISDAVIAETTCDGKEMFELIGDYKPLHVMDLPQLPDEPEAL